jgi:hypothetical protein
MSIVEMLGRLTGDIREVQVEEQKLEQEKLKTQSIQETIETQRLQQQSLSKSIKGQELKNELAKETLAYKIDAEYQKLRQEQLGTKMKEVEAEGYDAFIKDKYALMRAKYEAANIKLKSDAIGLAIEQKNLPYALGMDSKEYSIGVERQAKVISLEVASDMGKILSSTDPVVEMEAYLKKYTSISDASEYEVQRLRKKYEETGDDKYMDDAVAAAERQMQATARILVAKDMLDKHTQSITTKKTQDETDAIEKMSELQKKAKEFRDEFKDNYDRNYKRMLEQEKLIRGGGSPNFDAAATFTHDDFRHIEKRAKLKTFNEMANENRYVDNPQLVQYFDTMYNNPKDIRTAMASYLGVQEERTTINERDMRHFEDVVLGKIENKELKIEIPKDGRYLKNKAFRDAIFDVAADEGYDIQGFNTTFKTMQETIARVSGNYEPETYENLPKGSKEMHRMLREKAKSTIMRAYNSSGSSRIPNDMNLEDQEEIRALVYTRYVLLCEQMGIRPQGLPTTPSVLSPNGLVFINKPQGQQSTPSPSGLITIEEPQNQP